MNCWVYSMMRGCSMMDCTEQITPTKQQKTCMSDRACSGSGLWQVVALAMTQFATDGTPIVLVSHFQNLTHGTQQLRSLLL